MIAELEKVQKDIEKGRVAEALDRLLEVWRAKRAPALADAVDALAHAFPVADDGNVFTLVATLLEGPVSGLGARVEQLAAFPDDPRVAMAFANFALEPPTTSSSNFYIWTQLFASLEKNGDARVVPILKKRLEMKPGASKFWPKLAKWIEKALAKIPAAPKLTKEEAAAVAAIVKAAKKAKPMAAPKKKKAPPAAAKGGDPLARATAAVEANDLNACVEALLEVWRERRLAAFAVAIDRVTTLHDEGRACPGGSDKELEKAWRALSADRRAIDIGRLAAAAADGKVADAEKRLEEMLTWPEDPRIGRAMYVAFELQFFADRTRIWNAASALFVRNADVRFAADIAWMDEVRTENKAARAATRRTGAALTKAFETVQKEPTNAELVALAELDAALDKWDGKRTISERRHLEAILAAPKDNAPRLVYADWLTERGHPRGELIVLQCADEPDEDRIEILQRENARALLGPAAGLVWRNLGYALTSESNTFDRGLLQKIELRASPPVWMYRGHPLLWFIESIEPQFNQEATAASVIACTRSIRELEAQPELATLLARQPEPTNVETLTLAHAREDTIPLESVLEGIEGRGLSKVKHLEFFWGNGDVYQDGIPARLVASPLFANLESLIVVSAKLDSILGALSTQKRSLKTLSFLRRHYLDYRLDVTLDKDLAPTRLDLRAVEEDVELDGAEEVQPLLDALASLKLAPKTKLVVAPQVKVTAPTRKKLEKLVTLADA